MSLPSTTVALGKELLKPLIQAAVQETLEAEMTETLGAEKGGERGAHRSAAWLSSQLHALTDHSGCQVRAERCPGLPGAVLDRAVRGLSALGEGAGRGVVRHVRARRLDAEGEAGHQGTWGACLLGCAITATNKARGCVGEGAAAAISMALSPNQPAALIES